MVSFKCQLKTKNGAGRAAKSQGVIFGEVVLVHIKDELLVKGKLDPSRLKAVGCLGMGVYCRTRDIFEMKPSQTGDR